AAEVIGFDEGKKIPGSRAEEGDEKAELALHVSVLLGGNEAGFLVERSHEVEEAATAEFEAVARLDEYLALSLLAGDVFDGVDGHRHGEELANFGFVDVEGHGSSRQGNLAQGMERERRLTELCFVAAAGSRKSGGKPPHSKVQRRPPRNDGPYKDQPKTQAHTPCLGHPPWDFWCSMS